MAEILREKNLNKGGVERKKNKKQKQKQKTKTKTKNGRVGP